MIINRVSNVVTEMKQLIINECSKLPQKEYKQNMTGWEKCFTANYVLEENLFDNSQLKHLSAKNLFIIHLKLCLML